MSDRIYDVAVVGAGPAGACCAQRLAEAGLDVALIDQKVPAPSSSSSSGLVWHARQMLQLELGAAIEHECYSAQLFLHDAKLKFQVEHARPLVSVSTRSEFAHRIVRRACEAGVELLAPQRIRGVYQTSAGIRLEGNGGLVSARYCVAADGAGSRTARGAGWDENDCLIPAIVSEIRVAPADFERFAGRARFDFGLTPSGYCWVFPNRNHLSIGCLSRLRGWSALREDLDTYLGHLDLVERGAREDHAFVIPIAPRSTELSRGRVLLVGDAAGLADPVSCEGLSSAILSGRLAAEAIVGHREAPDATRAAYERLLESELLPELRTAQRLARWLYDRPRFRRFAFRHFGQLICNFVGRVSLGQASYRSLLRSPRNYFKLAGRLFDLS